MLDGDGSDPMSAAHLIRDAVEGVRAGDGPALLRLTVPRLSGHSGQDTQAYKGATAIAAEHERDPLRRLRAQLVPQHLAAEEWEAEMAQAGALVAEARAKVEQRPAPDPKTVKRYSVLGARRRGSVELQLQGGIWPLEAVPRGGSERPAREGPRINLVTAVRRTLEHELEVNPRVVVFGEDVGRKGGVHAATLGLQEKFGVARVFDTSLSEEGIIGRAVGMAAAGLDARTRDPIPQVRGSRGGAAQ